MFMGWLLRLDSHPLPRPVDCRPQQAGVGEVFEVREIFTPDRRDADNNALMQHARGTSCLLEVAASLRNQAGGDRSQQCCCGHGWPVRGKEVPRS